MLECWAHLALPGQVQLCRRVVRSASVLAAGSSKGLMGASGPASSSLGPLHSQQHLRIGDTTSQVLTKGLMDASGPASDFLGPLRSMRTLLQGGGCGSGGSLGFTGLCCSYLAQSVWMTPVCRVW